MTTPRSVVAEGGTITLSRHPYFLGALGLITGFFLVVYYLNYISYAFAWPDDLGLYANLMYHLTNGLGYGCYGYENCFASDHFRGLYLLFMPFYWVHQDVFTLIVLSVLATSATLWVMVRIAERYFNWKVCLVIFLFLLVHPSTLNMYLRFGAREALFPALFLALSLWFYLEKRFWPWLVSLVLAAISVEYISLVGIGYALVALLHRRRWFWGVAALVFGVGYFYLVTMVVMPLLRGSVGFGGSKTYEFAYLGGSRPGEIVKFMLGHPLTIAQILVQKVKLDFYYALLAPLMFLPLLGLEILLLPLLLYFLVLLPQPTFYANLAWHYHLPILPFVWGAAIVGLYRLSKRVAWVRLHHWQQRVVMAMVLCTLAIWSYRALLNLKDYAAFTKALPLADSVVYTAQNTLPKDAEVSAQLPFLARFGSRDRIGTYPDNLEKAEYVVLGLRRNPYPMSPDQYQRQARELLTSGQFGVLIVGEKGDVVLKRGHDRGKNQEVLSTYLSEKR